MPGLGNHGEESRGTSHRNAHAGESDVPRAGVKLHEPARTHNSDGEDAMSDSRNQPNLLGAKIKSTTRDVTSCDVLFDVASLWF